MITSIMRHRLPYIVSRACFAKGKGDAEPNFLEMVESYFDKAAANTKIPADKLNLYKKSECVIKFHLTLKRGIP
jgi:glutamate dehydrogenase (NAD(P)+)